MPPTDMPDRLVAALRCPICADELRHQPGALRCPRRHTFDVAKQGYVNLLGRAPGDNADDAGMVRAREEFLGAGHYAPLADDLAEAAAAHGAGVVLDAGAGTGYYLAGVLDRMPEAVGGAMDLSKYALRRAARAHPRAGAVLWDVWRPLPVRDGAISVLLNVFAPRNGPEFHRVLRPDGALVVVTPNPDHLAEAVSALDLLSVDERKDERLDRTLSPHFRLDHTGTRTVDLRLSRADLLRVAAMGPAARHRDPDELRRRAEAAREPLPVTLSCSISVYRPLAPR
jgi:23S rRNA (guanine745-N1)-methyltransferase